MFNAVISNLMATANERPLGSVEIRDDGLAYCTVCGYPKQVRVQFPWGIETPRCVCKCEQEQLDREKAEERERNRQELIRKNKREAFPDTSYLKMTFDKAEPDNLIDVARRYVDNFEQLKQVGHGLMFLGAVGCGKTFASACIVNALTDKGYRCKFTSFAEIIRDKEYDYLADYDLVVFDDFGVERWSDYSKEIVCSVINELYVSNTACIISTNFSTEEFAHPSDLAMERIISRLKERCLPVRSKHKGRRKTDNTELKALLGVE